MIDILPAVATQVVRRWWWIIVVGGSRHITSGGRESGGGGGGGGCDTSGRGNNGDGGSGGGNGDDAGWQIFDVGGVTDIGDGDCDRNDGGEINYGGTGVATIMVVHRDGGGGTDQQIAVGGSQEWC